MALAGHSKGVLQQGPDTSKESNDVQVRYEQLIHFGFSQA